MSRKKKRVRQQFRNAVFVRDAGRCRVCGALAVDAHHIVNRNEMPDGGYVPTNGIALCASCHRKAEYRTDGLEPERLVALVNQVHCSQPKG
jgi:5-methylcytosine-specific restriction endonuclease McrA